jgi:1-acyl-sn-glycerol-3-phosphate acyltransferase
VLQPFDWWRTVFYLIPAISLYTIVLGTTSLLSTLVDRKGNIAHQCARAWARLILATTGVRVTVEGVETLDPHRSYVFAANHQSIYDIPIVFASLPFQLRIVAKQSLGRIPFMGWHLYLAGHLLVDRRNPGADIVRKMARLVREGSSLIVFPEGTRSVDGQLGRFKKGSFLVALGANLPIVPITIEGSRHIMQKGRLMVRRGPVRVTVHEPIPTEGVRRDEVPALADRVRTVVAGAVR